MNLTMNGKELDKIVSHIEKIFKNSNVADDKGELYNLLLKANSKQMLEVEATYMNVNIHYISKKVKIKKEGSSILGLQVLKDLKFKSKSLELLKDFKESKKLHFKHNNFSGHLTEKNEVDTLYKTRVPKDKYVKLDKDPIITGLKGTDLGHEQGVDFLPLLVQGREDRTLLCSLDYYKAAYYEYKEKHKNNFSFILPQKLMYYIVRSVVSKDYFYVYSDKNRIYIKIKGDDDLWYISVPCFNISIDLDSRIGQLDNIISKNKSFKDKFSFKVDADKFNKLIDNLVSLGENKEPYINFNIKDSVLHGEVTSSKGKISKNIEIFDIKGNPSEVDVYSRFFKKIMKVYVGDIITINIIKGKMAIVEDPDSTFKYQFPISL